MKKLSIFTLLLLSLSFSESFAQFEGKIQFHTYEIEDGERVEDDDSFTLYITRDRMLIQGDEAYKVGGTLKTEGILIRQKEQDFVFFTGEKNAMKITKSGITSFMNMFGDDAKSEMNDAESNLQIENTGETKTINGHSATKFVFKDKQDSNKHSEVWMTKDLDIYWGMLAEPWGDNMKGFAGSELPLDLIFEQGYFPIQWQSYKNGDLAEEVVAEVSASDVDRSMVELSPDIKVTSLQEYLFEQMRKSQ